MSVFKNKLFQGGLALAAVIAGVFAYQMSTEEEVEETAQVEQPLNTENVATDVEESGSDVNTVQTENVVNQTSNIDNIQSDNSKTVYVKDEDIGLIEVEVEVEK